MFDDNDWRYLKKPMRKLWIGGERNRVLKGVGVTTGTTDRTTKNGYAYGYEYQ